MLTTAIAALVLPAAPLARCTTVPPMLYSEIVAEAQQIVIGTATASVSRSAEDGRTIRTFVTFDRMTWIKGEPERTLTLQLEGGTVGETRLLVPDMPEFKVGSRYLLYVAHNGTNLSPIVGFYQGAFEIVAEGSREILVAQRGRQLIGISGDRLVLAGKPVAPAAASAVPAAVLVPGFQPTPAAWDAAQRQAAERAWIEAHDRRRVEHPLPERVGDVSGSSPGDKPPRVAQSLAPERSPAAAQRGGNEAMPDKSPITLPPDQDRGSRISVQALLDTVPISGRR